MGRSPGGQLAMNALAKALRRCTLWLTAIIPSSHQSESSLIFRPGIGQPLMLGTVVAGPATKLLVPKKRSVPWAATARMAMAEEKGFGQAVEIRPDRDRGLQNLFDN
jgi:hypothetical protein